MRRKQWKNLIRVFHFLADLIRFKAIAQPFICIQTLTIVRGSRGMGYEQPLSWLNLCLDCSISLEHTLSNFSGKKFATSWNLSESFHTLLYPMTKKLKISVFKKSTTIKIWELKESFFFNYFKLNENSKYSMKFRFERFVFFAFIYFNSSLDESMPWVGELKCYVSLPPIHCCLNSCVPRTALNL